MFPLQLLFLTWLQEHCMICGIMPRTLFEINVKLLRRFFVQSVFIGYCVVNNLFSLRDVWGYKDYGRHHLPRLMKCKFQLDQNYIITITNRAYLCDSLCMVSIINLVTLEWLGIFVRNYKQKSLFPRTRSLLKAGFAVMWKTTAKY